MTEYEKIEELMRLFNYKHLPEHLQALSKPFHDLAHQLKAELAPEESSLNSGEVYQGLHRLVEAKDCIVRARLAKEA